MKIYSESLPPQWWDGRFRNWQVGITRLGRRVEMNEEASKNTFLESNRVYADNNHIMNIIFVLRFLAKRHF